MKLHESRQIAAVPDTPNRSLSVARWLLPTSFNALMPEEAFMSWLRLCFQAELRARQLPLGLRAASEIPHRLSE